MKADFLAMDGLVRQFLIVVHVPEIKETMNYPYWMQIERAKLKSHW